MAGGIIMNKLIITNKSDCELRHAVQMALQSLDVEVIGRSWGFKDFTIDGKPYTTRILNNKSSKRITIFNEPL